MKRIVLKDVTLDFPVYNSSSRSLKSKLVSISTGGKIAIDTRDQPYVRSLDHVSYEISDGERVALVGQNGSGKSTTLRLLAGVYHPTFGQISTKGKIASLIDLSLGMDIDATGYENIYMRATIMGMSPHEIRKRIPEIEEFTDLGEYLNMPFRTYSTGMQMRLAFAVSTCVNADILLMDEWISVGDVAFQEKAANRLNKLIESTPILIIATHSQDLVKKVCNRKIGLEHGHLIFDERL